MVLHARVAERSIAIDCKSIAFMATQVRILPRAQKTERDILYEYHVLFCIVRFEPRAAGSEEEPKVSSIVMREANPIPCTKKMRKDVVVKKSRLSGMGVFAARSFKKGEVVMRWNPLTINKEDLKKLSRKERRYINHPAPGKYFLMQPPERYVNHSCDANTIARNSRDVARRAIKKGEEITSDYEKLGPSTIVFKCMCGSRKCRGKVS